MVLATWLSRTLNLVRSAMGSTAYAAYKNGSAGAAMGHTVTSMGRWSILDKQLPPVDSIKAIHIYDFDNTLFKTPLPNPKLWNGPTIGTLANPDAFVNGGWWHDSRILAATGEGLAKEEPRAWEGWWNEKIVELIHLSNKQKDALCVLLTGRSESGFGELIKRMVTSKGLGFDLISLKPAVGPNHERFANTMVFKQMFLEALMETYRHADEIRIYEDRIKHVKGFRDFLEDYNARKRSALPSAGGGRPPITGDVIQVVDMATYLDPIVEVAEVQQLIHDHNAALAKHHPPHHPHHHPHLRRRGIRTDRLTIKKTVFYTGYMIPPADARRLLTLAQVPPNIPESELKYHANNIMICPRPAPPSILEKIGGLGAKRTWEVTGTACFENTIWAARVEPVPATARVHTGDPVPLVVLALRRGARHVDAGKIQVWEPVANNGMPLRFDTTVGEKILLRIEAEDEGLGHVPTGPGGGGGRGGFAAGNKRKHTASAGAAADDFRARPSAVGVAQQQHQPKQFHHQAGGGRGGAGRGGGFRGGGGGGASRGFKGGQQRGGGGAAKGRGGRGGGGGGHHGAAAGPGHHYKSLDDVGGRDAQSGFAQMYEDEPQQQQKGGGGGRGFGAGQNIPTGPSNPANPGFYGAQGSFQGQQRPGNGYSAPGAGGGPELNNYY